MRAQNYLGFLVAAVMLLLVVAYATSVMIDIVVPTLQSHADSRKEVQAYSLFHTLTSSKGEWSGGDNWEINPSDVQRIGLENENRVLSLSKIEALKRVSKDKLKNTFGPEYDYKICMDDCQQIIASTSDVVESPDDIFVQFPVVLTDGTITNLRVVVR